MNKKCFVEMPFDKRFDGIWLNVIKPTVESQFDECNRADDFFTVGSILNDIFNQIINADYIIADVTIHNPNVYYELGFSHALKKKVILITQDISSLPFDLRDQRVIHYQDTAAGATKLKNDLNKFINNI
jgi:nucleoside 2-deoxyribosyltransferase